VRTGLAPRSNREQWGNIRSYVMRDGHLFLAVKIDGGIYEFAPAGRSN
jgi:hypothetical protein